MVHPDEIQQTGYYQEWREKDRGHGGKGTLEKTMHWSNWEQIVWEASLLDEFQDIFCEKGEAVGVVGHAEHEAQGR